METKAAKDLEKELLFSQPHISDEWPAAREEAEAFCEDYKAFLNNAKTEREAAAEKEKRGVGTGITRNQGVYRIRDPNEPRRTSVFQSETDKYLGFVAAERGNEDTATESELRMQIVSLRSGCAGTAKRFA